MSARRWSSLKPLPTAFVGRAETRRALASAMDRARLVTMLGPPGTGKTRLAKEYALSTLGSPWEPLGSSAFEGGVFFCDLSDAAAPDDVLFRLAQTLGVDLGSAPRAALSRLVGALEASAPALVILDNFEQLVRSSSDLVGALVAANDRTRWLVTSRERLSIAAEALFDLGPLALPKDGGRDGEAIELFIERARAASRDFDPRGDELADVASLVSRLDGLPLAIELAAARTRVLSPREIIERLRDRFALLTRDTSTLGRGSATLWETIDASWALLSADEQRALGLLSVFRGGFDVPAAEHVIGAGGRREPPRRSTGRGAPKPAATPPATLDVLQSLRDKSLLVIEEGGPGARRFALLASIREFASERVDPAERVAGERRHADHYIALGESLPAGKRLALEHENVLVVHRRFLGSPHADDRPDYPLRAALIVCEGASAFPYALCLGLLDDAIHALDARRPSLGDANDPELASRLAKALEARGNLRRFVGRTDESVDDFERMRALADRTGERSLVAAALAGLGNAATVRARWPSARALFEQSLAIHAAEKDRRAEGRTLAMLAATRFNEDAPDAARPLLARALELVRESRDRPYEGICTTSLGIVTLALGALAEARTHLVDALRIHREGYARHWEGVTLAYLAMVDHEAGRPAEAHDGYARAIDLLHEIDVRRAEGLTRFARASLLVAEDRVADARAELHRALDLCRAMAPDHEGLVQGALGGVAAIEGDLGASVDLFACAHIALRPFARSSFAAAVDVYAGLLDLARARAAPDGKRAPFEASARARLAASADPAARSFEIRLARRQLERALAGFTARPEAPRRALTIGPQGLWFKPPRAKASVHLHRRRALQRIVDELARHRSQAPGEALNIAHLVAAGWPGERVLAEAGRERVYTAIATLRRLGLKGLLLQQDDGYLFDASIDLVRSASNT